MTVSEFYHSDMNAIFFEITEKHGKEYSLSRDYKVWLESWPSLWCQVIELVFIPIKAKAYDWRIGELFISS